MKDESIEGTELFRSDGPAPATEGVRTTSVSRRALILGAGALLVRSGRLLAVPSDAPSGISPEPYFAHVKRLILEMQLAGEPLMPEHARRLLSLARRPTAAALRHAEEILAQYTLVQLRLGRRAVGEARQGSAKPELVEQGWRSFLVRVENPWSLQQTLSVSSPQALAEGELSHRNSMSTEIYRLVLDRLAEPEDVAKRWLGYQLYAKSPSSAVLSGLGLEYQILQLYSRDRGRRAAYIEIDGGAASAGQLIREDRKGGLNVEFVCLPSTDVALSVKDWDGAGTMASFVIRDEMGRLYPAPAHRLEPDFDFQPQVYRADEESVRLPEGRYTIDIWRGPEYVKETRALSLGAGASPARIAVRLKRWINAAALGWYPGDTHIHAAGCAHYEVPTAGVTPETMIRHVRGEALAVGDVLNWSPAFYYQERYFTGHVFQPTNTLGHPEFQRANNVSLKPEATPHDHESMIRYDIEVSGFPSSHSGHLVLLRLKSPIYDGAHKLDDWPSWNLPVVKWARAQGAVVGYAHCGAGMAVKTTELPNYEIPAFDYVGANEYIVDVVQNVVDFVSGGELTPETELNFWYHTLNCGFRTPMVGETDFPCFSHERPGTGRTYVGIEQPPSGDRGFDDWVEGIKRGRVYFGDGRSHFIDYQINRHRVGGDEVRLSGPGTVTVTARTAARLEETPISADDDHLTPAYAYWHLERARIDRTRKVPLEIVVNGRPVLRREILADGQLREFSANITLEESSWVALRILPSGHTAPVFVDIGGKPVRASKRSAQWCFDCLDALWQEKGFRIRPSERGAALAAYDNARRVYKMIKAECSKD